MSSNKSLFEIRDLQMWYRANESGLFNLFSEPNYLRAIDNISFDIKSGEILGVAGQSGCGKSTLGELLLRLRSATGGKVRYRGENVFEFDNQQLNDFRKECQIVFQNPYESLNPRFTVSQTVIEPLRIHGIDDPKGRDDRVMQALKDAGLTPPENYLDSLPSELSGGERQRVSIARAIVIEPEFLVADEPVSMLDVSVRTEILQLFNSLREKRNLTVLYISHDLATINQLTDRTLIMYLGDIMEIGPTKQVIHTPAHPYTEALLESVPNPDPDARHIGTSRSSSELAGDVPDPVDLPDGCRFNPRCKYADKRCHTEEPALTKKSNNCKAACFHPVDHNELKKDT